TGTGSRDRRDELVRLLLPLLAGGLACRLAAWGDGPQGLELGFGQLLWLAPALAVVGKPGTRRDKPADDNILLQAAQVVAGSTNRGLGEDAGGFLERGRRDEGLGGKRRLGDAQQHGLQPGRLLVPGDDPLVLLQRPDAIGLLALEVTGVARVGDL